MLTREVKIRNIKLGEENRVVVQGMLKNPLNEPELLINEAKEMIRHGAEMLRCAVPEEDCAVEVYNILKDTGVPLIADCHFQTKIALQSLAAGFDKVRVNPGNMSKDGIKEVIGLAVQKDAAIRFGFNTGSCDADTGEELAMLALEWDKWVKEQGFENFLISMKSSSVIDTVDANRMFSIHSDTPLHIGITATGPFGQGIIKSAAGLGSLLLDGVGATLRVSLTGDSVEEIKTGVMLREYVSGNPERLQVISCPTCSRCRIDVRSLVDEFLEKISDEDLKIPHNIAIMGCEVNGPGEAKSCDIGICGTKKGGLFIKKGEVVKTLSSGEMIEVLIKELREL
ncbi:flavodoxin-dependent (E)-4-hydroxy-3-methylbut-2-enyl-diphosphate synthase [Elusimicrobiota bacterium]